MATLEAVAILLWNLFFPAAPVHIAIYLRNILKTAKTISPIECAVYSIAWAHNMAGVPPPTQNPLVTTTLDECECKTVGETDSPPYKKPIQPHMIGTFLDSCIARIWISCVPFSSYLLATPASCV